MVSSQIAQNAKFLHYSAQLPCGVPDVSIIKSSLNTTQCDLPVRKCFSQSYITLYMYHTTVICNKVFDETFDQMPRKKS